MNLKEKLYKCNSEEELPTLEEIKSISRGIQLKIIFENEIKEKREEIGEKWKEQLPNFSIGIHTIEEEIYIQKLITDEEIELNKEFFEICAKEYGKVGLRLITQFVENFQIEYQSDFPLKTLNAYEKGSYKQSGTMGEWKYFFHGFHCAFHHKKTAQSIEVPLTFGEEYGALDPFFFIEFIQSSPELKPLPIKIYDEYGDGKRILEVMTRLGKFEEINSNLKKNSAIIVKDREKKEVKIFENGMEEVLKHGSFKNGKSIIWENIKRKLKRRTHNNMQ